MGGSQRHLKVIASAAFLLLSLGVIAAYNTPMRAFEVSIYAATPLLFWVGVSIAMSVSLWMLFFRDELRQFGMGLAVVAASAVFLLPRIRGYWYMNRGDSLSHLGIAKDFASGGPIGGQSFYPGIHFVAIVISRVTGIPIRQALMLEVGAIALLFVLITIITVGHLSDRDIDVSIAMFAGIAFLPVSAIGTYMFPHSTSQAIPFAILPLYFFIRLVRPGYYEEPVQSRDKILFLLTFTALVLFHPQQAVNLTVLLGAGWAGLRFTGAYEKPSITYNYTTLFILAGIILVAWATSFRSIVGGTASLTISIYGIITNFGLIQGNPQAQTGTLVVGGPVGLAILFLKVYGPELIFIGGTVIAAIAAYRHRFDDRLQAVVQLLVIGLVPVGVVMIGLALGQDVFQGLRYVGFMMAVGTILGAIGLRHGSERFASALPSISMQNGSRYLIVGILVIALVMSGAGLYRSPFVNLPSSGITEQQAAGFGTTLEHRPAHVQVRGMRGNVERFSDGLLGGYEAQNANPPIYHYGQRLPPGTNASTLVQNTTEPTLVAITSTDRAVEFEIFDGQYQTREGVSSLDRHPSISKVLETGGMTLYYVEPRDQSVQSRIQLSENPRLGAPDKPRLIYSKSHGSTHV